MKTSIRTWLGMVVLVCVGACGQDAPTSAEKEEQSAPEAAALNSLDEMQASSGELGARDTLPGGPLYAQHCAQCHDGSVAKAPHTSFLEMMTPDAVLAAMNDGIMAPQAAALSDAQRIHVAEYVTLARVGSAKTAEPNWCEDRNLNAARTPQPLGWGHDTARNTDVAQGGIAKEDVPQLALKWSFVFPNALRARSQPSVGYGSVFSGSQSGLVYAFDLQTGCVKWTFQASAEVRTGIVLTTSGTPLALFGDILAKMYAVNALTGELVWQRKADDHPSATLTGTPAFHEGRVYVPVSSLEVVPAADPAYPCCSFRGSVLALQAESGEVLWQHYTIPQAPVERGKTRVGTPTLAPSGAPIWSSPTVDPKRNLLYVGTGENYSSPADENSDAVLAIDLTTGERVWQRQSTAGDAWNVACMMVDNPNCPEEQGPDFDHGSSILLVALENGSDVLAAGHKDGSVLILDPDQQGELLWTERLGRGSIQGGVHFGMAAANGELYVPINDMNDTRNGQFLDPDLARPGVSTIDLDERAVLWQHVQADNCGDERPLCDPGVSAPLTSSDGVIYAGHLDGYLRAYDSTSGDILWSYDTTVKHTGVNGLVGQGGGMSGAGPAIADGHLIVNSGYGLYFHEPGNVLLVFAPAPTQSD